MARAELVKDTVFQTLLKQLQDCLVRDQLEDDLRVMNTQIMNSMRHASAGNVEASKSASSLSISVSVHVYSYALLLPHSHALSAFLFHYVSVCIMQWIP